MREAVYPGVCFGGFDADDFSCRFCKIKSSCKEHKRKSRPREEGVPSGVAYLLEKQKEIDGLSVLFGKDGRVSVSLKGETVESRSPSSKEEAERLVSIVEKGLI